MKTIPALKTIMVGFGAFVIWALFASARFQYPFWLAATSGVLMFIDGVAVLTAFYFLFRNIETGE